MNIVLIKGPANLTGEVLRQTLLEALLGNYDIDTDTYSDHPENVMIPASGTAPGTHSEAGAQICQLMSWWTQAQIESLLEDASLTQYNIVGMQTFETYLIDQSDPPEYAPIVSTAIEQGTMQYLNKRYSDEAGTIEIPPSYNWFPGYAGQSEWEGV